MLVFFWWCFCKCVFAVMFLWWCFCGVLVVVFLWWCSCGGAFVVVVVVFLWWCDGVFVFLWWCFCMFFFCQGSTFVASPRSYAKSVDNTGIKRYLV